MAENWTPEGEEDLGWGDTLEDTEVSESNNQNLSNGFSTQSQDSTYSELYGDENSSIDVEEVAWSKKKTALVILAVLFFLIIVLLTVKNMDFSKKSENSAVSNNMGNPEMGLQYEGTSNYEENYINNSTELPITEGMSFALSEETSATNPEIPVVEPQVLPEPEPIEVSTEVNTEVVGPQSVAEPSLGDLVETQGIVSGKNVYCFNSSYLYEVSIIIVTDTGDSSTCSYFCPKKTYDALTVGMSLSVGYQLDANGIVSIMSISN